MSLWWEFSDPAVTFFVSVVHLRGVCVLSFSCFVEPWSCPCLSCPSILFVFSKNWLLDTLSLFIASILLIYAFVFIISLPSTGLCFIPALQNIWVASLSHVLYSFWFFSYRHWEMYIFLLKLILMCSRGFHFHLVLWFSLLSWRLPSTTYSIMSCPVSTNSWA